jgi:tetratricopeptide (TPR) repeat protein
VIADSPRIQELRRRVQEDPASIAFAQLAEEYRRAGDNEQAAIICRAGLEHHPTYLSARVTLGRALIELNRLDEALQELTTVLTSAPENLPAIRAVAEIHQRQGRMPEALDYYRRALTLAKYDPELESTVERIENVVSPPPPKINPTTEAPKKVEDLFDFDTLLQQLGGRPSEQAGSGAAVGAIAASSPLASPVSEPNPILVEPVALPPDDFDPLSILERRLRETEQSVPAVDPNLAEDDRVLDELERWLAAIVDDSSEVA